MVYYVGYRFTDSNVCMKFNMGLYLHIDLLSVSTWIPSSFRPVANLQVTERHLLLDRRASNTTRSTILHVRRIRRGAHDVWRGIAPRAPWWIRAWAASCISVDPILWPSYDSRSLSTPNTTSACGLREAIDHFRRSKTANINVKNLPV